MWRKRKKKKEKREKKNRRKMSLASSTLLLLHVPIHNKSTPIPSLHLHRSSLYKTITRKTLIPKFPNCPTPTKTTMVHAGNVPTAVSEAVRLIQSSPPTWQSAILSNFVIFVLGSPILVGGLSFSGIVAAFLLGTLTWRAFGPSGFLLVATYFVIGTAATKVKMAQKEAQGVAERRKGRRGPGSVIGSSTAGCICAFLSIFGVGGKAYSRIWELGFVASFCTKLSDTIASEIGKAYGKTTYLVTTFKVVPRGTEGAVSVEGTFAGVLASILLASVACLMGQINAPETVICVLASQIANLGESIIGAALQEKEGFQWLTNDAVNVINITMGSILAVLMRQFVLQNWWM
ncbi:protein VTE6, chloroplastic isoform X2 [Morus notabilis]|uniref:protein VTE6, chloroplastic isoform X2 n=1 Tax=Morus notabilis TaxID=981085 RepID=UPI000CECFB8B|nr:protein VTE6, chloroplastic isoform X2 [Morus notabilis]